MAHYVFTDTNTGFVLSDVKTPPGMAAPVAKAGQTRHDVTASDLDIGALAGKQWNGSAFITPDPPPVRTLSKFAFLSRFTVAEKTALEMLAAFPADTLQAKQTAAAIRVWQRELNEAAYVDLDDPVLVAPLAALKPVMIAAGVWADLTVANTRVTEILA